MLRAIDQDIGVAEQPFRYFGLSVGNRMTVVRSQNQELIVISPIQISEKDSVKQSAKKILDWNFERVIMAHGSIVEHNGKSQFKAGYEAFLGQPLGDVT